MNARRMEEGPTHPPAPTDNGELKWVRHFLIFVVLSLLAVAGYLVLAQIQNGEFGFPLDDAWIHQVYARSLGTRGEFGFFPGQPSAGSTSPLWALILAIGYALHIDYRVWTIAVSILLMAASAAISARIARRLGANEFVGEWLVPLFVIFEWHLTWAAASGMEIPLFICLSLALVEVYQSSLHPFWIGIAAGLLALARPEGAALGLLVATGLIARAWQGKSPAVGQSIGGTEGNVSRWRELSRVLTFFVAFALFLLPYAAFNLWSSGSILPNTFYAKSQEYAELLVRPIPLGVWLTGHGQPLLAALANFLGRSLGLYRQPLLGAQILLVPGLAWICLKFVWTRKWDFVIPLVWIAMLPAMYAVRLPVDYQYGRYEMPIIPFIGIYGIVGTERILRIIPLRFVRRAWGLSIAVLVVAFAWLGANQYASSVAIINCEMVSTARWTAANLPAGALIAAHDIGAQGYFDSHPMLDLAGLVSPEVIPFIRDDSRLRDWMKGRGASYAVFFPTWYPKLAADPGFVSVHSGNCAVTKQAGEADLEVYKIALTPP